MNIFLEIVKAFLPNQDGFVFMWILLIISLSAIILIIERWLDINRRTNVNASGFVEKITHLIQEKKVEEAYKICASSGKRALPRIIGAGLKKSKDPAELIISAMEEESLHMIPILEKRINYILVFGNVSTLLGLMGTIFGLILSFAAVAQPGVDPIEKSSLLASGISTAMNTTLLGLIISVPCILIFSLLKSKIDLAIQEIDRYSASILKVLLPQKKVKKEYRVSGRRIKEEIDTEPNIAPMMNLMVILIPLLLTSAEFVKIGAIELKLPEASQGGNGQSNTDVKKDAKLNLGIVITEKGFNLFHYFRKIKKEEKEKKESTPPTKDNVEIPKKKGKYDYNGLNAALAKIKKKALYEIIHSTNQNTPKDATLLRLNSHYTKSDYSTVGIFNDHENVKIVAEENIKYETVIAVMDAARGTQAPHGKITMFPNVSLAGGITY